MSSGIKVVARRVSVATAHGHTAMSEKILHTSENVPKQEKPNLGVRPQKKLHGQLLVS